MRHPRKIETCNDAASYYSASTNRSLQLDSLKGDRSVDVCIIGAGFSGINTAIELALRGMSVVVLEAKDIGSAASGRNGGQLIRGCGHGLEQFERYVGREGVSYFEKLGIEAVELVKRRVDEFQIDCDLRLGFCELANTDKQFDDFQAELESLERLNYPHRMELIRPDELHTVVASSKYRGGLIDNGSGHLHPLNLLLGETAAALQLGVDVHIHSTATHVEYGDTIVTSTALGKVHSKFLVLAGNAHLGKLVPTLNNRILPAGSYIIATEPLSPIEAETLIPKCRALCDQRVGLDYYRLSADRRLLFGGACRYSGTDPKDVTSYMRPKMLNVFPQLSDMRIDYAWGGVIGVGANRLPQIGRLPSHSNVYYAQAYSGHGVNMSHMAGKLLAEAIAQQSSSGLDLFNSVPHLAFPGGQHFRAPLLALGMLWLRIKEILG